MVLHIHSLEWLTSSDWIVQIVMGGMRAYSTHTGFWKLASCELKFKFILILSFFCIFGGIFIHFIVISVEILCQGPNT